MESETAEDEGAERETKHRPQCEKTFDSSVVVFQGTSRCDCQPAAHGSEAVDDGTNDMQNTRYLKKLVCVEHEQYDAIQDTAIAAQKRLTYIVNGFDLDLQTVSEGFLLDLCRIAFRCPLDFPLDF